MAAKIETLATPAQLSALAAKNSVVVLDFHATWCGPCKLIAPTFSSLASTYASPNKVAFAKVDVDAAPAVAAEYSVRAMPTFVILSARKEVARVQGADRAALTAAVEKHCKNAKGFAAAGKGYTLGSAPPAAAQQGNTYMRSGTVTNDLPLGVRGRRLLDGLVTFVGLYFTSLLSLDPMAAAAEGGFARPGAERGGSIWGAWGAGNGGGSGGSGGPAGRRLGTVGGLQGGQGTIGRVPGGCCG